MTPAAPLHGRRALPNRIGIFALSSLLGLFAGCGGGMDGTPTPPPTTAAPPPAAPAPAPPPPPVPTAVTVTPEKVELMSPGATAQLAAEVRDQRGQVMTGVSVTWASSDERTARVDTAGLVTAVAGGMAKITATAGEASGTSEVMVIIMDWATDFLARTHVVDGLVSTAVRVDPTLAALAIIRNHSIVDLHHIYIIDTRRYIASRRRIRVADITKRGKSTP